MRIRFMQRADQTRRRRLRRSLDHVLVLGLSLSAFYLVPISGRFWDLSALWFFLALLLLVVLVVRQLTAQAKAGSDPSVGLRSLLFLLYPIIAVFALAYYILVVHSPSEIDGLVTRTDSLYFTIVTLGTVGYGDIHPVGQVAKVITMIQIVFDLVVIGLLLAIAATRMMNMTEMTIEPSSDEEGGPGAPSTPTGSGDDPGA
jgi:hypothetical protein